MIDEKIDIVIGIYPKWEQDINRKTIIDELIRRYSHWIGQDTTLSNEIGHLAWLNSSRKNGRRYWPRYRTMLENKMGPSVINRLEESTEDVLSLLEDPLRDGIWDRRGLVVGHVQSGKTGHYTGLICKAADAGYKIIIVLTGMHNNHSRLTQIGLDEGILGSESTPQ
jgi:hypothetical protein